MKKPVTASAAWSVPTTSSPCSPAIAYCATMRMRALTLPLPKSLRVTPVGVEVLLAEPVDRALDVELDRLLRLDELEGDLRIGLVVLHVVGQAHRDESCGVALGDELLDGQPAEATRERGVLAAADPEDEPGGARRAEVRLEEVDPSTHLLGGVDDRADIEFGDDSRLQVSHPTTIPPPCFAHATPAGRPCGIPAVVAALR